jgi:sulfur carrier protein ThiS
MSVVVRLPSVLRVAVGAERVKVKGDTVSEALEAAFAALPNLRQHLLQKNGSLRPHVLCLVNDQVVPRGGLSKRALVDGDEVLIHQAISGG